MKKLVVLCCVVLCCAVLFKNKSNADAYTVPKIVLTLHDTNSNIYELQTVSDAKHGVGRIAYSLKSKSNDKGDIRLFSGTYDAESGGCNRHELLNIDKAFISEEHVLRDINQDTFADTEFTFVTEDCASGKTSISNISLITTNNGFELKRKE
ncbi:MAG: hypothetical protein COV35_01205 [Alphaproteobacteria bacterium CG11_big_fil_rev_8_21_14_0_20_39_49]|nr:MAG: hypothetical protein COV35_01205 [Alphaproteobacteria bacterium CG11_big_fil_rev_8_21_14_0_20_39_49]